jgi:hypothetical protein
MGGWKWEVELWAEIGPEGYRWHMQYQGDSLIAAMRTAREARRNGIGCVRLQWRP